MTRNHKRRLGLTSLVVMLAFAVPVAEASRTATVGPRTATRIVSTCSIVISGSPWRIRVHGTISGDKYTITARNMPCSAARTAVLTLTKLRNPGAGAALMGGPRGFTCKSFTTPDSGAKLVISGVCMRPPHNDPFFGWGPKVR